MSKKYKIGLVIEGDGKGGVKAVQATEKALSKLDKTTSKSSKRVKEFGTKARASANSLAKMGVAAGTAGIAAAAFAGAVRSQAVRELSNMADATNTSVEALSGWGYAAETVGLSAEKIGDIFKDVNDRLGDFIITGGGEAKDIIDSLGISLDDLSGKSPDVVIQTLIDRMDEAGASTQQTTFLLEAMGNDLSLLKPLLEDNAAELNRLRERADLLNVSLSDYETEAIDEVAKAFDVAKGSMEGLSNGILVNLGEAFEGLDEDIEAIIEEYGGMEKISNQVFAAIIDGLSYVVEAFEGWELIFAGIEAVVYNVEEAFREFLNTMIEGIEDVINNVLSKFHEWNLETIESFADMAEAVAEWTGSDTLKGVAESARELASDTKSLSVDFSDLTVETETVSKKAEELTKRYDELVESSPAEEMRRYADEVRNKTTALEKAEEQTKDNIDAQSDANDAVNEGAEAQGKLKGSTEETSEALKIQGDQMDDYAAAWEAAVERIDTAFSDGWLDLIQGESTDVFNSIKEGFERMLAEMAHAAITKPIVLQIQSFMSDSFGLPGGGGGGGGFGSISSFFSGNSIGSGFESFGMGIDSFFGGGGSMFSGAAGYSNLAYGGAGILGGLFGSTAGNDGGIGGSIGATLGLAVGGPIGAVIGGVLGGAVGSLFGGEWEQYENGLAVSYNSQGGFNAQNFTREKKDRGLWRGNDYRTNYTDNDSLTSSLGAILGGVFSQVESAADILGIDEVTIQTGPNAPGSDYDQYVDAFGPGFAQWAAQMAQIPQDQLLSYTKDLDEYLAEFSFDREFDFTGLSEAEATQQINDFIIGKSNELVQVVFGESVTSLQREGEALVDTLNRVMTQLSLVDNGFSAINLSLEQLAASAGVSELAFSDDVVNAAGGTDRLAALLQGYQSAFFTEEELLARTLESMADQVKTSLDALGIAYGDDFRAAFEAASANGLAAEDLVSWLEAGNLLGQFEAVGEQLSALTGDSLEDILRPLVNDAQIVDTPEAEAASDKQAAKIADPIVDKVSTLNDTVNDKISTSNENLTSINDSLKEVQDVIAVTMDNFKKEVQEIKLEADQSIAATNDLVQSVATSVQQVNVDTSNKIRDLGRLIAEPIYRTQPVLPPEPLV